MAGWGLPPESVYVAARLRRTDRPNMTRRRPASPNAFSMDSPHDMLQKLACDISDLRDAPDWNSTLSASRAINCFLTLWHLTDWFWAALRRNEHARHMWEMVHADKSNVAEIGVWLCANVPAMRVAQQVATSAKHFGVARADANVLTSVKYTTVGASGFRIPLDLMVEMDGTEVPVVHLIESGYEFWSAFLDRWLPDAGGV